LRKPKRHRQAETDCPKNPIVKKKKKDTGTDQTDGRGDENNQQVRCRRIQNATTVTNSGKREAP